MMLYSEKVLRNGQQHILQQVFGIIFLEVVLAQPHSDQRRI